MFNLNFDLREEREIEGNRRREQEGLWGIQENRGVKWLI